MKNNDYKEDYDPFKSPTIEKLKVAMDKDEKLFETFIGQNYDEIYNMHFSIWLALLSYNYYFYRKMYLRGIILIILYLFLFTFYHFVTGTIWVVITSFFLACTFRKDYFVFVQNKIRTIKEQNSNTEDDILPIIKKSGGTSKKLFITSYGLSILLAFICIIIKCYI